MTPDIPDANEPVELPIPSVQHPPRARGPVQQRSPRACPPVARPRRKGRPGLRFFVGFVTFGLLTFAAVLAWGRLAEPTLGGSDCAPPRIWLEQYTATTVFEGSRDAVGSEGKSSDVWGTREAVEHELAGFGAVALVAEELKLLEGLPRDADWQLTPEGYLARKGIVEEYRKGIRIRWGASARGGEVVTLSVTCRDQTIARRVPDLLVTNYINLLSTQIVDRLVASRDFCRKQVNDSKMRRKELQKEKLDFETEHVDAMPDSPRGLNERIGKLSEHDDALRMREETARVELAKIKGLLKDAVPPDTAVLNARIAALEAQIDVTGKERTRIAKRIDPLVKLMKNFTPIRMEYMWIVEKITKEEAELDKWTQRFNGIQMDLAAEVAKKRTHLRTVQSAEEPTDPDPLLDIRGGAVTTTVGVLAMALFGGLALLLVGRPARD